ncbi:hypothetical protein [Modestobacter sp. Leaf380]|uniref:hypothetical protein n=1 Tax=Modestobacter sp. Leaf380 TaxID=1736356 RepID=UPI0012FBE933|nr:hypothetical protein [Modestobacter sp. Leaf380]
MSGFVDGDVTAQVLPQVGQNGLEQRHGAADGSGLGRPDDEPPVRLAGGDPHVRQPGIDRSPRQRRQLGGK